MQDPRTRDAGGTPVAHAANAQRNAVFEYPNRLRADHAAVLIGHFDYIAARNGGMRNVATGRWRDGRVVEQLCAASDDPRHLRRHSWRIDSPVHAGGAKPTSKKYRQVATSFFGLVNDNLPSTASAPTPNLHAPNTAQMSTHLPTSRAVCLACSANNQTNRPPTNTPKPDKTPVLPKAQPSCAWTFQCAGRKGRSSAAT